MGLQQTERRQHRLLCRSVVCYRRLHPRGALARLPAIRAPHPNKRLFLTASRPPPHRVSLSLTTSSPVTISRPRAFLDKGERVKVEMANTGEEGGAWRGGPTFEGAEEAMEMLPNTD